MRREMSVTDARIHFGEVLRQVEKDDETIVVNGAGKPRAVIMSIDKFNRMGGAGEKAEWQRLLEETHALIRQEGSGRLKTPVDEVIRQMREERDERILASLRAARGSLKDDVPCNEP